VYLTYVQATTEYAYKMQNLVAANNSAKAKVAQVRALHPRPCRALQGPAGAL
jgi:hypothetical protein